VAGTPLARTGRTIRSAVTGGRAGVTARVEVRDDGVVGALCGVLAAGEVERATGGADVLADGDPVTRVGVGAGLGADDDDVEVGPGTRLRWWAGAGEDSTCEAP
jgi:hypothetical protein